jgi:hypothetical protein
MAAALASALGRFSSSAGSFSGLLMTDSVVSYCVYARGLVEARERRFGHLQDLVRVRGTLAARGLDRIEKRAMRLGKDAPHVPQEPVDVLAPREKNAAQQEARATLRMRNAVCEPERRAPRAAENRPLLDLQRDAQLFHVADERVDAVRLEPAERRGLAAAALIEEHDAPLVRFEHLGPLHVHRAAGAAVHDKHHGRLARALRAPVDRMTVAHVEHAFVELHRRLIVHCALSLLNVFRRGPLLHRFDDTG